MCVGGVSGDGRCVCVWGWSTYLPAYDGHLPPRYLVYAFQLAFVLVDQTGYVLHGLICCLYVTVITEMWEVNFNHDKATRK